MGRTPRRAREIDRGCGARNGEHLSRSGLPLPSHMTNARRGRAALFQMLLAQFLPFTLVIDEQTAGGDEARVSKTSVCGSWGPIAGELRYFADKFGNPRASIEGTQIPYDLLRPYATVTEGELVYYADSRARRWCCDGGRVSRLRARARDRADRRVSAGAGAKGAARARRSAGSRRSAAPGRAEESGRHRVRSRDVPALRRARRRV